jgi:dihydroorotase
MHEGRWSLRLGLRGIPAAAEEMDAVRDCALSELTGARVHLAHVSTRGAIDAVRRAKARGLNVTCEVTPHHFALTDEAVESYDTNTKMNPPLRSREHVSAILEGLKDGTIDAIATDHAPHHADEKSLEYDQAPFGITGLETAVGLALDKLVHKGTINLERLVQLCSVNPARIFGLADRGTLRRGAWGDVTILDPEHAWTFDAGSSKSKSRNTPFDGWAMRGAAVATIVSGRVVYRHPDLDRLRDKEPDERAKREVINVES